MALLKLREVGVSYHMSNHEILGPALQKYYSALKSLYDFGQHGDFFDDVSNLDKFFSEFRNITLLKTIVRRRYGQ